MRTALVALVVLHVLIGIGLCLRLEQIAEAVLKLAAAIAQGGL